MDATSKSGIRVNISEIEREGRRYIKMLTNEKDQEIRKEMIKFLKEAHWEGSEDYSKILEFINDFFVQNQTEW